MINEQAPECCPFCGSGIITMADGRECRSQNKWVSFRCFTNWHRNYREPRKLQSLICEDGERRRLIRENERLTRERDELRAWKESAMAVEREWDANAIATILGGIPGESQRKVIAREVPKLLDRVKRLEEAGQLLDDVADAADDDIREHLQVANYNLHGLLNTGERIQPPNPPQTIHQAGIDASVAVREDIRKARNEWRKAKEATP